MKKHFPIFASILFLLASCSPHSERLPPKSLDHYVIDFFVEKSIIDPQVNKKTFYFYKFGNKNTYRLESNDPTANFEKEGIYEYFVKNDTKASITCYYDEKNKNMHYKIFLSFEDSKSGTWRSPAGNTIPGAETGTFVIVKLRMN